MSGNARLIVVIAALVVLSPVGGGAAEPPKSENALPEKTLQTRKDLAQEAAAKQAEATSLLQRHELDAALREGQRALAIQLQLYPEKEYPDGTPAVAMSLLTVGNVLRDQGQYAKAREHYEKALRIYQHSYPVEKYPKGHLSIAVSLNNLGVNSRLQGDQKLSATYLEQALSMFRQIDPQGSPGSALCLNNLADTLYSQGEFNRSAEHYLEALAVKERLSPHQKPSKDWAESARKLNALGTLLREQAAYDIAADCFTHALALGQQLYPSESYPRGHDDIALSLLGLANVRRGQGQYDEARKYGEDALAMYRQLSAEPKQPSGNVATALNNLGELSRVTGDYERARDYFAEAMEILERLYPPEKYPQGHIALVASLNNLAATVELEGDYEQAQKYDEKVVAMDNRLYPPDRFPQGNYALALGLNNLALILERQGAHDRARAYFERSLTMFRQLYPTEKFPVGHPALTTSLNNLATMLESAGEYTQAKDYQAQVLAMRKDLYPKAKYPQGHPSLAAALAKLGSLLLTHGESKESQVYLGQALAMRRQLYPDTKYPQGHPELAESLLASNCVEEAMAMYERLYPPDRYLKGHPYLAISYVCFGNRLREQGKYPEAKKWYEKALAMFEQLYPKEGYPDRRPELALSLNRCGHCLLSEGDYSGAVDLLQQATAIENKLTFTFLAGASEAETLNFLSKSQGSLDDLIAASASAKIPDADIYAAVWVRKGLLFRGLALRQQLLAEDAGAEIIKRYQDYLHTRRLLARLMLAPADPDPKRTVTRQSRLAELSRKKELLERDLASKLPEFRERWEMQHTSPSDLVDSLPQGTVLVDFLQYVRLPEETKPSGKVRELRIPCYVAFVSGRGHPVVRVDLGPAEPIDQAIKAWREDILARRASPAAAELRRLVWSPVSQRLPEKTTVVLVCPDAALAALPWAALPGRQPGTVLIDEYAVALLPYPQFPLIKVATSPASSTKGSCLLEIGDVSYDDRPRETPSDGESLVRGIARGSDPIHWNPLPGTKIELAEITKLAPAETILPLTGVMANASQVLADLPRANWAHFATHGFFADRRFRSVLRLDESQFQQDDSFNSEERATVAGRNPLVLSGIVLAGANLPRPTDEFGVPQGDGGILAAETIAGLSLPHLEIAVLSACETGLGDVAGGEGVFGLQRAFHQAGAKTTVASLWRVDDAATRVLMNEFYHNLWARKLGKLESLRQAQLTVLHEFDPQTATLRGPGQKRPGAIEAIDRAKIESAAKDMSLSPFYWASFVLSGEWR